MKTFKSADILLPKDADMSKWSVVACDQYTSEPEYWEKAEEIVGDAMSTLKITFPEAYLTKCDEQARIESINKTMLEYMPNLAEYKNALIYLKRTMADGKIRHGIIGAVDLEDYDYNKGSDAMIRATEGTVLERIPPRVKIRENASLELPHVMLLIDDRDKTVIEPLYTKTDGKIYDFELMLGGGHAEGYLLSDAETEKVMDALTKLSDKDAFNKKYNTSGKAPMLFAVGDGNHSLATAKACYENLKKKLSPEEAAKHPARYALVEVVNLHDDSLEFKPIHRVVFGCDPEKLISELSEYYAQGGAFAEQKVEYCYAGTEGTVTFKAPASPLEVGNLQKFLDEYIKKNPGSSVDYIHGDDVTRRLGTEEGNIGFILPPMSKNSLFETVIADGVLPRKTFSMGEACEKRFYLECRKIAE